MYSLINITATPIKANLATITGTNIDITTTNN